MRKLMMSAVLTAFCAGSATAQLFEEGNSYLHIGAGIGSPYAYSGSKMGVPPLHVSFEKAVSDRIGVGGLVGYTSSKWDQDFFGFGAGSTYEYSWNFSYLIIGARGAYHFVDNDRFDAYGGLMLGYNIASAKFETNDPDYTEGFFPEPSVGGVAFGAFVGGRYALGESSAIFAELGYNISWLSLGYCHRF